MTDKRFFQLEVSYALAMLLALIVMIILTITTLTQIDELQKQPCRQEAK